MNDEEIKTLQFIKYQLCKSLKSHILILEINNYVIHYQ